MTDKEKILAKIESLLNETNYEPFTDEVFGRIQTLKELKSYIDSLQKEPASDGLEEEIERYCKESLALKFPTTDKELIKSDIMYIARHFAEWGRNHFEDKSEMVGKDLEEEITKCYKSRNDLMMTRKQFGELIHRFTNWQHGKDFDDLLQSQMKFPKEFYEKGKSDAIKEMMKDAVEGTVVGRDRSTIPPFQTKCKIVVDRVSIDAKEDDKVKVIITKN